VAPETPLARFEIGAYPLERTAVVKQVAVRQLAVIEYVLFQTKSHILQVLIVVDCDRHSTTRFLREGQRYTTEPRTDRGCSDFVTEVKVVNKATETLRQTGKRGQGEVWMEKFLDRVGSWTLLLALAVGAVLVAFWVVGVFVS
jgi:hypothetical protein